MWVRIVGLVAVFGILVSGCSGATERTRLEAPSDSNASSSPATSSRENNPSSSPSPSATPQGPLTYEAVIADGKLTTSKICADYEKKIEAYASAARKRLAGGRGKSGNAYVAADFRRTHPWVKDPLAKRFVQSMVSSATSALNTVSDGQAGLVDVQAYLQASLAACGLDAAHQMAGESVKESVSLGARIRAKANTKPWYARGFKPYGGELAFRWIDNAGVDCSSRCWYWTIEVMSRTGCPSGVYGELGIERGGTAIAWANDSLSYLRPRQKGRLQFITYSDGAYGASGSLGQLTCY